jgi:arylsulfatase A-like enzyme
VPKRDAQQQVQFIGPRKVKFKMFNGVDSWQDIADTMKSLRIVLAVVCAAVFATPALAADSKPNILVILADDLGYADLGCYGGEIETPNLDALARGGLQFSQAYNTARCWPSRAAIMTGFYAQQVRRDAIPGVASGGGNRGLRPAWAPLLPEMLKPLGYRAYHSGKWHIDGKPLENGFDRSYEITTGQNNYFKARGALEDGKPAPESDTYYATTATADFAVRCLRDHAAKFPDRPFFQYLCFIAPHFPLQALPEDIARYRDRYRAGWDVIQRERHARQTKMGLVNHALPPMEREVGPPYAFPDDIVKLGPGEVNRPLPWSELNEVQRQFQATKMAIHAAMVDRMDGEIGRVIAQLKQMGAFENTLIVFASDNGASAEIMVRGDGHDPQAPPGSAATYLCLGPGWSSAANTPLRRHKTWVHEGGINTPFIAHWPKGIRVRGELRHNPTHLIDVVPTALDLAGLSHPKTWKDQPVPTPPGRSLVPAFVKDNTVTHDALWWLHEDNRAIRVGDWKLVAAKGDPWELYDLSRDRGESQNLAAKYPDKARELEKLWTTRWEEFSALARKDAPAEAAAPKAARKKKQK